MNPYVTISLLVAVILAFVVGVWFGKTEERERRKIGTEGGRRL